MHENEAQLLNTLETATKRVAVTRCSRDFRYLWANQAYADWVHRSLNEIVDRPILEVLGKDAFEALLPHFNRVLTGETVRYEQETNFQGIGPRWISATYTPTLDAEGVANGWVAVVLDSTERKHAEEVRLHTAIVESSEDAIISKSLDAVITSWNAGAEHIFGFTEAEVVGQPITILIPPELRDEENKILEKLRAGGRIERYETKRVTKAGHKIDVSLTIGPIKDSTGKVVGFSKIAHDITQRKRAEEALRSSEERLRLAHQAAHIGAFEWNIRTGVNTWTPELESMYGLLPGGFVGTQAAFENLVHPDDRARVIQLNDWALKTGQPTKGEWRVVWPDGSVHWLAGRWQVFMSESGEPLRMVGVNIDVTDRRLAEQELATASERLHLAIDSGSVGGWDFDLKTDRHVWFGKAHAQLGMAHEETLGSRQEFWDRVHEDDREHLRHAIRVAKDKHEEFTEDFRVVWRDGTTHWLRSRGRYHYAVNGDPERMLGISLDITQSKQAEEALRESEQRLRLATQAGRMYAYDWDVMKDVVVRSSEHVKILGLTEPLCFPQQQFVDKIHPDDRLNFLAAIAGLSPKNPTGEVTYRMPASDGTLVWLKSNGRGFFDAEGRLLRVIGMVADVTDQKRAEEALLEMNRTLEAQGSLLRSREELLRVFVKNVPAAVAMLDRGMRYLQVSDRWCSDYLPGRTEILGRSHYELFPEMPERWKEFHRRAFQGETLRADEDRWDGQDGTHWARWEVRPWKTAEGVVGGILILAEDITRRKQMEEALSDMSRKLIDSQEQERARVARELHDDINQRLALVAIGLDQLREKHKNLPSDVRCHVQELQQMTSDISSSVYALSHELYSSIPDSLGLARRMKSWCRDFGERRKMEIDFKSHDLPRLPQEISLSLFRVLQEALQNAAKHSGAKRVEVQLAENSGEIHLIVSDSGKGFNVKSAMQSRGLGLTSMQERVRLVGGTIAIDSQSLVGTTIHVCVPFEAEHHFQKAAG
jgi:PAS domain S-box-containing protein